MAANRIFFAVSGARSWENPDPIRADVRKLVSQYGAARLLGVHGRAPGADTVFDNVAYEEGVYTAGIRALWDTYHRSAGPQRNAVIFEFQPVFLLAYHWDLKESKGTADAIRKAKSLGIKVMYRKAPLHVAMPSLDTTDLKEAKAERQAKSKEKQKARRAAKRRRDQT